MTTSTKKSCPKHDPLFWREDGCLVCRALLDSALPTGMSSLEALTFVRSHRLRVTFDEAVTVEAWLPTQDLGRMEWLVIAKAATFIEAVIQARDAIGRAA